MSWITCEGNVWVSVLSLNGEKFNFYKCRAACIITLYLHYCDVKMSAMVYQITSLTIVCSTVYSVQIKENIKAPRHWPLCGKFTGDRWIPRTNGQLRGKCFHLMTSSCNRDILRPDCILFLVTDLKFMLQYYCESCQWRNLRWNWTFVLASITSETPPCPLRSHRNGFYRKYE